MTSEVTSDLGIELDDLNDLCSHVSLASKGLHELNDTEEEEEEEEEEAKHDPLTSCLRPK